MAIRANCRVCGKEFNACKGVNGVPLEQQPLNWRKICCSPPCGSAYLKQVFAAHEMDVPDGAIDKPSPPPTA